jgi:hypothetical protein
MEIKLEDCKRGGERTRESRREEGGRRGDRLIGRNKDEGRKGIGIREEHVVWWVHKDAMGQVTRRYYVDTRRVGEWYKPESETHSPPARRLLSNKTLRPPYRLLTLLFACISLTTPTDPSTVPPDPRPPR